MILRSPSYHFAYTTLNVLSDLDGIADNTAADWRS